MLRMLTALVVFSAGLVAQVNPVVQWNRNLLVLVRTPGVQPATIHSTRSFAMMHVAIYDAVNNIVPTHQPYAVHLTGISPAASADAAAASAAHDLLVGLYPGQRTSLDTELQQSLALIPAGPNRDAGVAVGSAVAAQILSLRANDGDNIPPPPFVFGSGPGVFV